MVTRLLSDTHKLRLVHHGRYNKPGASDAFVKGPSVQLCRRRCRARRRSRGGRGRGLWSLLRCHCRKAGTIQVDGKWSLPRQSSHAHKTEHKWSVPFETWWLLWEKKNIRDPNYACRRRRILWTRAHSDRSMAPMPNTDLESSPVLIKSRCQNTPVTRILRLTGSGGFFQGVNKIFWRKWQ